MASASRRSAGRTLEGGIPHTQVANRSALASTWPTSALDPHLLIDREVDVGTVRIEGRYGRDEPCVVRPGVRDVAPGMWVEPTRGWMLTSRIRPESQPGQHLPDPEEHPRRQIGLTEQGFPGFQLCERSAIWANRNVRLGFADQPNRDSGRDRQERHRYS